MDIEISPETPLQTKTPILFLKEGCLLAPLDITWPNLSVLSEKTHEKLPVAWSLKHPGQLRTREIWTVHARLNEMLNHDSVVNRSNVSELVKKNLKSHWTEICPSVGSVCSMVGLVFEALEKESLDSEVAEDVRAIFKATSKKYLYEFTDEGQTLLDLAIIYGQWLIAEELWEKGVRFSKDPKIRGEVMAGLLSINHRSSHDVSQINKKRPSKPAYLDVQDWANEWFSKFKSENFFENMATYSTTRRSALHQKNGLTTKTSPLVEESALSYWLASCRPDVRQKRNLDELGFWIEPVLVAFSDWDSILGYDVYKNDMDESRLSPLREILTKFDKDYLQWLDIQLDKHHLARLPESSTLNKPLRL